MPNKVHAETIVTAKQYLEGWAMGVQKESICIAVIRTEKPYFLTVPALLCS